MKLSIAWIFDHLNASWKDYPVAEIAQKLTMTTAEIERVTPVSVPVDTFSVARVTGRDSTTVTVASQEWNQEFTLPARADAATGSCFLITRTGWVTMADMGGSKEGLFPAIELTESDMAGAWKQQVQAHDYILELDNVAITHRPDLWSHRGFAREVGALFNVSVRPLEQLVTRHKVRTASSEIVIKDPAAAPHYAGLRVEHIESGDCILPWAVRLCRVDIKPISAIVDATNYVMCDIGQPLHAFDAQGLVGKKIVVQRAQAGQALTLRDGALLELAPDDLVIADEQTPHVVAGITGDGPTMVTANTTSLFIESATFDAKTVRATATRLKMRTDASTRFEKGVSPYTNVAGIERFINLMRGTDLAMKYRG